MNDPTVSTPDSDITIARLAVELHTSIRTLLGHARDLHIPVHNSDQPLTDVQAENIRTLHAMLGDDPLAATGQSEVIVGFTPGTIVREPDAMIAAIERNLGVGRHRRRGPYRGTGTRRRPETHVPRVPPPRRPQPDVPAQRAAKPPLTGLAAEAVRRWTHMPEANAEVIAEKWTQTYGFTEAEAIAWWDGGVQFGFPQTARELESYSVQPHHLMILIGEETVGARLRRGLSPRRVAERLERAGHLRDAG